jgi:cystathionine beta-lyase/cystathionine gamma-synthase
VIKGESGFRHPHVRLSVGIEHIDDILGDLGQALAKAASPLLV